MLPKVVTKEVFNDFVAKLISRGRVVGPKLKEQWKGNEFFDFGPLESVDELRLDYPTSYNSPKQYFLPSTESLLKFTTKDASASEPIVESEQLILLGVHPCDISATWLLDIAFELDNEDPNYLKKREKALIIGLDCEKPCDDSCFCADMGTNQCEGGFDLMLTDLGDRYFIDVGTERGQDLLCDCPQAARATGADHSARQEVQNNKEANFQKRIPMDMRYMPELLSESYDNLVFEATARRCFSCGSCNLVCPTCYCFDVFDDVNLSLKDGERKRTWDSCMLKGFAEVAGGENFREDPAGRLKHRIFRKGKYLLEKYGKSGCVGCGRCGRACVANISISEIFTQLSGSTVI